MYPFRTKVSLSGEDLLDPHPLRSWRTTPCRLSSTAYSIYSQLPSILEAVPPSAAWGPCRGDRDPLVMDLVLVLTISYTHNACGGEVVGIIRP